jgi:hypothetical protein
VIELKNFRCSNYLDYLKVDPNISHGYFQVENLSLLGSQGGGMLKNQREEKMVLLALEMKERSP